ncbi:glucose 1-dehydrogenase [Anaerobacillus sp. MEB173]|uniref:glucose 1-dehydrogenase n=1 Tax=Anaerobacillus sp. MEB173 TaxID=3383345 RepID=UPI003F8F507E
MFIGKVVIVTGAGKGIGQEVAVQYASKGAKVMIAEKDKKASEYTKRLIIENGGVAEVCVTDVSKPDEIITLIEKTVATYGTIDILINNAGVSCWTSPYDLNVEEWDKVININLRGVFLCAREAAKVMKENGGGSIVNMASTRALMSEPNSEAYAASKGGIVALTHALALSLGKNRIRVNAISPGWIETGDYEQLRTTDHIQHPAQRVGRPSDIARACFYLTAEENDFITGINHIVDGGMTRKMMY